jgi:hypothetical protein
MQVVDVSRLRTISTCSTRQNRDKNLICIEHIKACLFPAPGSIPLLCFWIFGADKEVEDIVCRRPNFLNYRYSLGFIESSQVEEVWLLVKFVENGS